MQHAAEHLPLGISAEAGGNRGTILNAADEVAVAGFLEGRIGFGRIPALIESALDRWGTDAEPGLEAIATLDAEVRAALGADSAVRGDP